MLSSECCVVFRLKLMFLLFEGNPKHNLEPKYHLMKYHTNGSAHQFYCNILQMKSIDLYNLLLSLQGLKIGSVI